MFSIIFNDDDILKYKTKLISLISEKKLKNIGSLQTGGTKKKINYSFNTDVLNFVNNVILNNTNNNLCDDNPISDVSGYINELDGYCQDDVQNANNGFSSFGDNLFMMKINNSDTPNIETSFIENNYFQEKNIIVDILSGKKNQLIEVIKKTTNINDSMINNIISILNGINTHIEIVNNNNSINDLRYLKDDNDVYGNDIMCWWCIKKVYENGSTTKNYINMYDNCFDMNKNIK